MTDKDTAETVGNPAEEGVIVLSTGVKLRGKPVPPGVFINLNVKDPPPLAPAYKSNDGSVYTNPDDPNYIEQMKFWSEKKNKDMLNAMIIFGTEVDSVPKGVPKLEDVEWIEKIELTGIATKAENKSWRYLWWALTVAAPRTEDWNAITEVVGRLTGVPEKDVDAAAKFPGSP